MIPFSTTALQKKKIKRVKEKDSPPIPSSLVISSLEVSTKKKKKMSQLYLKSSVTKKIQLHEAKDQYTLIWLFVTKLQ